MTAAWFCRRWIGKRRCGARMVALGDHEYRCPRCEPTPETERTTP